MTAAEAKAAGSRGSCKTIIIVSQYPDAQVLEAQLATPAKEVRQRGYKPSGKDQPLEMDDDQVGRCSSV